RPVDPRVDDHQQRGLVAILRQALEEPARERGLPLADATAEDGEPPHALDHVEEPDHRPLVLWGAEVEALRGRVGEGLVVEAEVLEVAHGTLRRIRPSPCSPGSW